MDYFSNICLSFLLCLLPVFRRFRLNLHLRHEDVAGCEIQEKINIQNINKKQESNTEVLL